MSDHELLTKAQVIREYKYPKHLLHADLASGAIPHFCADGQQVGSRWSISTYYIPRYAVENRIREMAGKAYKKPS